MSDKILKQATSLTASALLILLLPGCAILPPPIPGQNERMNKSDAKVKVVEIETAQAEENNLKITPIAEDEYVVTRVVDGDTIELDNGEKVRYIGIDTPETKHPTKPVQCFGKEASNKNTELVLGKTVRLEEDITDRDRYGRLLRFVYVGDTFVNYELVRQGYAYAYTYPPDVTKSQLFVDAQKQAREEGKGLWTTCKK